MFQKCARCHEFITDDNEVMYLDERYHGSCSLIQEYENFIDYYAEDEDLIRRMFTDKELGTLN